MYICAVYGTPYQHTIKLLLLVLVCSNTKCGDMQNTHKPFFKYSNDLLYMSVSVRLLAIYVLFRDVFAVYYLLQRAHCCTDGFFFPFHS